MPVVIMLPESSDEFSEKVQLIAVHVLPDATGLPLAEFREKVQFVALTLPSPYTAADSQLRGY